MNQIAYIDCFSGISGDMLLGALLNVKDFPFHDFMNYLNSMTLIQGEWNLTQKNVLKGKV